VLDIGGGTGSFLIPVLRRHPALQGTLFELPGACAAARRRLADEPEAARVAVVEGDFLKDPLPSGHDALIVANTVHVLSAAHNVALMKNMRAHAAIGWMRSAPNRRPRAGLGRVLGHLGRGSGL
jgi:hypothetical protein